MTNQNPDLYAVLGISRSATQAEIRRAYRALLRRHHPDTHDRVDESSAGHCGTALQQVLAAYTVLGDPVRRAGYDSRRSRAAGNLAVRATPQPLRPAALPMTGTPITAGPIRWHPNWHADTASGSCWVACTTESALQAGEGGE